MTDSAAHPLLDSLSDEQRAAAEALRGPVAILAGAGTGKTRTITHRIAYGVETGLYAANRVLALTFTARAAHEMRARLAALGVNGVSARTFHAAALAQLGYFWPQVVGGNAPQVLPGKARTLAQAAETLHLTLGPETIRDIATEVEWRKVHMLDIDAYAKAMGDRSEPDGVTGEQLLDVMRAYEQLKDERKQIDFEDVLIATAGMLESEPRVALQVREQYRYFTVDEYQDVSPLQHCLLTAWLGDRFDLCVVGDPSQTIYSFAGASHRFLLQFAREFDGARVFKLEENYRSTHEIVAAANQLVSRSEGALTLRSVAERSSNDETHRAEHPVPEVVLCDNEAAEAEFVAERISALLATGTQASDVAVLYRTNAQSAVIESALQRAGVSYQVHGAQRFFDRPVVKQAVMTLRAAALAPSDEPLFQQVGSILRALGWTVHPPSGAAQRETWEALNAIYALADEAPAGKTLKAFADELSERAKAHIEPTLATVTLSAIHAAKGLEWSHVFVVGCVEGLLPISYAKTASAISEERRLLYVAMTRAATTLTLTAPEHSNAGRPRTLSPFVAELGRSVTQRTVTGGV